MSDMQPMGTPLVLLDGVERRVLFTLSVVDEIQAKYNETVPEVFQRTGDLKQQSDVVAFLVTTLINHANKREKSKDTVTEEYVKDNIDMIILPKINRSIARSYGYSVPEDEEDEEDEEPETTTEPSS